VLKELDGKIGYLVIDVQKKKRSLEQEHTETQMVQVRYWVRGHWGQRSLVARRSMTCLTVHRPRQWVGGE